MALCGPEWRQSHITLTLKGCLCARFECFARSRAVVALLLLGGEGIELNTCSSLCALGWIGGKAGRWVQTCVGRLVDELEGA